MVLLILSAVSFILGVLFLVDKKDLQKLSDLMNKIVINDDAFGREHPKSIGFFLVIFSALLLFVYLKIRH